MSALLLALILQAVLLGPSLLGGSISGCPDPTVRRFTFAVSGARSDFVLSSDASRILFSENGSLRSVSTDEGNISTLRTVPAGYPIVKAIPGRPAAVILASQIGSAKSQYQVWLASLTGVDATALDLGDSGSDGNLVVSQSGRYLATGTDYECYGGERDCFARSYSVFSTKSGRRLFSTPVPSSQSVENNPDQGTETRHESLVSRAAWAEGDVLVLEFYSGPAKAFARSTSGSWRRIRTVPPVLPQAGREHVYGPSANLVTTQGVSLGTVVLSCYFGPELGTTRILRGRDRVLLLKASPPVAPTEALQVVFYSFRDPDR